MGKIQDAIEWFKEVKDKTKDKFGTGIEALKPGPEMMGILNTKRR